MVKSFEVCQLPVRCARFIVRKQWFITASDDMHIRVFNYNTMEKVRKEQVTAMCRGVGDAAGHSSTPAVG